jgi:hypothetical protein
LQKYLDEAPAESGPLLPLLSLAQPASPSTEASVISEFLCLEGDRRNQYWIYRYTARRPGDPTFRVVRPPNWGEAIGGHDLFTREEAEKVARDACNSKS